MDILVFCNRLHTRTYINAYIKQDAKDFFIVARSGNDGIFSKKEYTYILSK